MLAFRETPLKRNLNFLERLLWPRNRSLAGLTATQVNVVLNVQHPRRPFPPTCVLHLCRWPQGIRAATATASLFRAKNEPARSIYFSLRELLHRLRSQRRHGSAFHRSSAGTNQAQGLASPRAYLARPLLPIHSHSAHEYCEAFARSPEQSRRSSSLPSAPCSPTQPLSHPLLGPPTRRGQASALALRLLSSTSPQRPTFRQPANIAAHLIPTRGRIRSAGIGWAELSRLGGPTQSRTVREPGLSD